MNILKSPILFLSLVGLICGVEGTSLAQAAPVVTISTPANGARELAAAYISLNVEVTTTAELTVTQLNYYVNGNILGVSTSSLYSTGIYYFSSNLANVAEGTYTLTAVAWDSQSMSGTSAPVTVVVAPGMLAGDVDGDGLADPALYLVDQTLGWRDTWYFWLSSSGYGRVGPCSWSFENSSPEVPVLADFDGDQKADQIVIYPRDQMHDYWCIWLSGANYARTNFVWGAPPRGAAVAADFDGDHKADPTMLENGLWNIRLSGSGYGLVGPISFNIPDGTPVPADYDGDRLADPAVVDASGIWHVALSTGGYYPIEAVFAGASGIPLAGDFDGDGLADPAVYQIGGQWYFWLSSAGYMLLGPYQFTAP